MLFKTCKIALSLSAYDSCILLFCDMLHLHVRNMLHLQVRDMLHLHVREMLHLHVRDMLQLGYML